MQVVPRLLDIGAKKNNLRKGIAEVVGSTPTRSTFSCCTTTVLV
jgi:hypothetical protein